MYKAKGVEGPKKLKWPSDYFYRRLHVGRSIYDLEEIPGFEDLKDGLIIDWGRATRSWHQWLKPKATAWESSLAVCS